jgi:hypothetical protein
MYLLLFSIQIQFLKYKTIKIQANAQLLSGKIAETALFSTRSIAYGIIFLIENRQPLNKKFRPGTLVGGKRGGF